MQTLSAFPTRPLRVNASKPKTIRRFMLLILRLLIALGTLAAIFVWMGPSLLNDARIQQNPVMAEDGELTGGKCRTQLGLLTMCNVSLTAPGPDGTIFGSDVSYFFLDIHPGNYNTDVVQSADDPRLLTTSLGLDYFWDRLLCFAAVTMLLVFGIISWVRDTLRQNRDDREVQALDGQMLTPVPVSIRSVRNVKGTAIWKFSYPAAGREAKAAAKTAKDFLPFTLDAQGKRALAVTGATGGTPFLLDAGLTRLELTDPERRALLEAQRQDQASIA